MKKCEIVYTTSEHVKQFFGDQSFQRLRGFSGIVDGEVIGLAGIRYDGNRMILFSDMKEKARNYKKDIVKMIHVLKDMLKEYSYPVFAIACKNEMLSEKILVKLGFKPMGCDAPDGKVYWR